VILEPLRNHDAPLMDKQPTRAGGWGISRSAPSEPWASVLQPETVKCPHGQHAFRPPLPTEHIHGAKEAAHTRARVRDFSENRRAVERNCPWEVMRHVAHVRYGVFYPSFQLQNTSAGLRVRHVGARADHRGQGVSFRSWATRPWEGKLSRVLTPF
jgi:hypothetical protein